MRILILIFLFSCSDFKKGQLKQTNSKILQQSFSPDVQGSLELLIAFWWPQEMYPGEEQLVEKIIDASQNISKAQDIFMKKRSALNCSFQKLDCLCHLDSICENGNEPQDETIEKCSEIQDQIFEADNNFDIESDYNSIKENLNRFKDKGEWINSFLDFDSFEFPILDTQKQTFYIPHWADENNNLDLDWISYSDSNLILKAESLEFNINIRESKFLIQGSGIIQDHSREGVIYFEIPKETNKNCDNPHK